uniref:Uncharacterized protein n=1 Tax=Brassica oleracea TaxID=3712 RepID=A0A3P6G1H2_BRAOL|nr:unnamed protein product [Brassica oleracea]
MLLKLSASSCYYSVNRIFKCLVVLYDNLSLVANLFPGAFAFYRAEEVPQGFHSLGHYCQRTDQLLRGYILAARASKAANTDDLPPLKKPVGYTLVWSVNTEKNGGGYFWLPNPPVGCKAMGVIVKPLRRYLMSLYCIAQGKSQREPINSTGSNLPSGGSNDMEFWIDLPEDEEAKSNLKNGVAEYLGTGGGVAEPCWLQYMREWGPLVEFSIENIVDLFPIALYGEEGPTGPKEKDNWEGDELC